MIENSREVIFVADHTEFGKVSPIPIATLEQATKVVTDSKAPAEFVELLGQKGVEVIFAQFEEGDLNQNGNYNGNGKRI
jgi:DeoR/GlpR family transcriptional regulator of sugar metabolism